MRQEIFITPEEVGQRLDRVLSVRFPDMTRSAIQHIIENGHVRRESAALKKNYRVVEGDCITVELPEPKEMEITPQDIPLERV